MLAQRCPSLAFPSASLSVPNQVLLVLPGLQLPHSCPGSTHHCLWPGNSHWLQPLPPTQALLTCPKSSFQKARLSSLSHGAYTHQQAPCPQEKVEFLGPAAGCSIGPWALGSISTQLLAGSHMSCPLSTWILLLVLLLGCPVLSFLIPYLDNSTQPLGLGLIILFFQILPDPYPPSASPSPTEGPAVLPHCGNHSTAAPHPTLSPTRLGDRNK